jgi:hypothetical protein
LSTIPQH